MEGATTTRGRTGAAPPKTMQVPVTPVGEGRGAYAIVAVPGLGDRGIGLATVCRAVVDLSSVAANVSSGIGPRVEASSGGPGVAHRARPGVVVRGRADGWRQASLAGAPEVVAARRRVPVSPSVANGPHNSHTTQRESLGGDRVTRSKCPY